MALYRPLRSRLLANTNCAERNSDAIPLGDSVLGNPFRNRDSTDPASAMGLLYRVGISRQLRHVDGHRFGGGTLAERVAVLWRDTLLHDPGGDG